MIGRFPVQQSDFRPRNAAYGSIPAVADPSVQIPRVKTFEALIQRDPTWSFVGLLGGINGFESVFPEPVSEIAEDDEDAVADDRHHRSQQRRLLERLVEEVIEVV